MTLVCAPAGYGKSVLLSDWTRSLEIPVAWIILDESESALSHFLVYFLAALDSLDPGAFESTRQWLVSPELPSPATIAHELINTMLDTDRQLVLVLDDYHQIEHGSQVHEFVQEILKHPPANFHLVLATRRDPPFALAKLRANNQLTEIRQADLKFEKPEAVKMFSSAWGDIPESELINELQEAVEGWAAGLRMVALAGQHLHNSGRTLSSIPEGLRQVHEYLLQEVIETLHPSTQHMLFCSAVPEKFCAGLLDDVAEYFPDYIGSDREASPDGLAFIQLAQQENMFITALDASGTWYRYHQLFRELLLQELQVRLSAEERALISAKVASLLEELGMLNDAIRIYVEAGQYSAAADVVDRNRIDTLDQDKWWRVAGWLQLFPAEEIGKWPGTLLARAWIAQYNIDLELISDLVRQLEIIEKEQGLTKSQLSELDYFRGFPMFWSGDIRGAREMCERADRAALASETMRGEVEAFLALSRAMDGQKELALKHIQELKMLDAGKRGALASRLTAAELYIQVGLLHLKPSKEKNIPCARS